MKQQHILVVDDEKDLCEILQYNLENENFQITVAHSGEEALMLPNIATFDLIIMDVMMGEITGYKAAASIKKNPKTEHIPIVFLTARDTENDTLTGFSVGADDYIAKPFSIRELIARVKAILKRNKDLSTSSKLQTITFDKICLLPEKKEMTIGDQGITLTKIEFEILYLFLSNMNRVFTRDEIMSKAWPENSFVSDRTIDVNMTRLRKKIGEYAKNIVTRHGYGYGFLD